MSWEGYLSQSVAFVKAGPEQYTVYCIVGLFHFRSLGVNSEENERQQSQSYSLAREPERLVVWEPCAQRRSARTSFSSLVAVCSGPVTEGNSH